MDSRPMMTLTVTSAILMMTTMVTSRPLRVVDLTHTLDANSVFWPGNPSLNFTILHRGSWTFGQWLESNAFSLAEHGGTHIDAPSHFVRGRWRAHQVPPSRLVGPGVVVDVRQQVQNNNDYEMTVEDLTMWEKEYGTIPDGAVVLMQSGWSQYYPDRRRVFGTDNIEDPTTFHFPGIHEEAARWLAEERNISVIGVDTPSFDNGITTTYAAHKHLLSKNIVGIEYVANLDRLPPSGATIVVGLVKLRDASGGPARVLGLLSDVTAGSDAPVSRMMTTVVWCILGLLVVRAG